MVGGVVNRRDEGSLVIKNTNGFAALETLRKKKKSDKDKLPKTKSSKSSSSGPGKGSDQSQQRVFWALAPLKAKSWADVDDDDDDDYYATNAPPPSVWGKAASQQDEEQSHEINDNNVEDTESDEDLLDEGDEEIEEEHENELDAEQPEPLAKKSAEPAGVTVVAKEADKQLSKKEKKKKELAELDALLADFGVAPKESNGQDESHDVLQDKKDGELDGEGEKKDNAPGESKSSKKKKKKSKESKDEQDQPNNLETLNGAEENVETEHTGENISSIDVKERLKKMASVKKKKPGKDVDSAARAAAQEAAARNAKLVAAKKKEKSHYNQQPVR